MSDVDDHCLLISFTDRTASDRLNKIQSWDANVSGTKTAKELKLNAAVAVLYYGRLSSASLRTTYFVS